jgi:hypothetical protein
VRDIQPGNTLVIGSAKIALPAFADIIFRTAGSGQSGAPTVGSTVLGVVQLEGVNRIVHCTNKVFIGVSGSKVCIAVVNPDVVLLCKVLYILQAGQARRRNDPRFRLRFAETRLPQPPLS